MEPPLNYAQLAGVGGAVRGRRAAGRRKGSPTWFTRRRGLMSTACLRTTPADPMRVASSRGPLRAPPPRFQLALHPQRAVLPPSDKANSRHAVDFAARIACGILVVARRTHDLMQPDAELLDAASIKIMLARLTRAAAVAAVTAAAAAAAAAETRQFSASIQRVDSVAKSPMSHRRRRRRRVPLTC